MSSHSEVALLQLMHLPGVGPRTQDKVLSLAAELGLRIDEFLDCEISELHRHGLRRLTAASLREAREQATALHEQLAEHDIRVLAKGQPGYPASLLRHAGKDAPPILFVRGNLEILAQPGVAFCGSRRASEIGLEVTRAYAEELAQERVNIISGYANGVDLTAHVAALEVGGATTLVLAEGILRFRLKPELVDRLEDSAYLIVSQFPPRMTWTAGNAMQRNGIILGLADAAIVIESGEDGGTFAAGEAALAGGRPLYVVDYPTPPESASGNRLLLRRGGRPLAVDPDRTPDLAPIRKLLVELRQPPGVTSSRAARQPSLFAHLDER